MNAASREEDATALFVAAYNGYLDVTDILLKVKADASPKVELNGRDHTAAGIARVQGHMDVVRLLEKSGAR